MPADGLHFGDGLSGRASGYNDGSIMNPGRHFSQADDFVLGGESQWQIDSFSFACGIELNAEIQTIRVKIYEGGDSPAFIGSHSWQYEEALNQTGRFQINRLLTGGMPDTYELMVNLNLSDIGGPILSPQHTYYLSIEADCLNPDDVYKGYDTYYQRFYWAISDVSGQSWGTETVNGIWQAWQLNSGDFAWSITGHQIPEPAMVLLMGIGYLFYRRQRGIISDK